MIVDFNHSELDDAIDERITKAFDIWDRYGKEAFDEDYRLVPREVYDLQECHLLSIIQEQQEQITELRDRMEFELRIIKNIIKDISNEL